MNPGWSMYLTTDTPQTTRQQHNATIKKVGVRYWQKLWQTGIPPLEARKIAAAIAKFDIAHRPPSLEQKQLITRYSPLICRAQLWRKDLLLSYSSKKSQRVSC